MSKDRKATGIPTRCIELNPTSKSVRLAGRYISLAKLEEQSGLDHGYVSYIFQGKRVPSLTYARTIAKGLGMLDEKGEPDINGLMAAIEDRKEELEKAYRKSLAS
jgi:transcriptional regulator with XRE-family HTH domain